MLAKRLISIGSLIFAAILLYLGNHVEYGEEAYFYPNLIVYFLIVFALILLVVEAKLLVWIKEGLVFLHHWFFDAKNQQNTQTYSDFVRLIPMFVIIISYLYLADIVGLYTMSFIAFALITIIYTTERPRSRALLKCLSIALVFMGVIYGVFAILLKLQTPSAWLI